jgi:uncharacterized membrane protein YccC
MSASIALARTASWKQPSAELGREFDSNGQGQAPRPLALLEAMRRFLDGAGDSSGRLESALTGMATQEHELNAHKPADGSGPVPVILHRDWGHAFKAGLRTLTVLLILGVGWIASGWSILLVAMMGASILCSIFATIDAPKRGILVAVKGTLAGTIAASLFVVLIEPYITTLPFLLMALAPFTFVGGLALADRKTAPMGMDFSMVFLLIAAPTFPLVPDFQRFTAVAPGPLLGALAAAFAFHCILPTDPSKRLADHASLMVREIQRLAVTIKPVNVMFWRARALHRSLTYLKHAAAAGMGDIQTLDAALHSVNAGVAVFDVRRALSKCDSLEAETLSARKLLQELSAWNGTDLQLPTRFSSLAERIGRDASRDVELSSALGQLGYSLTQLAGT